MTKVYVNPGIIATNSQRKVRKPPIVIEFDDRIAQAFGVFINGPSRIVYDPTKPTIRVWIDTDSEVTYE